MSDPAEAEPNPAMPVVVGLLLPWLLFLAAFAPRAWWLASALLMGALAVLLVVAARWAYRDAARRGLDAAWWAALAVLTLGTALLLLRAKDETRRVGRLEFLCDGCGRLGDLAEPFCYGCGRAA